MVIVLPWSLWFACLFLDKRYLTLLGDREYMFHCRPLNIDMLGFMYSCNAQTLKKLVYE